MDAVVNAQRGLASEPWPADTPIRVRMGLHTGEGRLGGDDYFGIDVHLAARISAPRERSSTTARMRSCGSAFPPWVETPLNRDFDIEAHWALYVENYLEGFHIPFVHAGLNQVVDYGSYSSELFRYSNLQVALAKHGESAFDAPAASPDHGRPVAVLLGATEDGVVDRGVEYFDGREFTGDDHRRDPLLARLVIRLCWTSVRLG
jgi:hypothetical protein